jgi:hypothetical protein
LIPFTPPGESLEVEIWGYLMLFRGLSEEVKKMLRRLKETNCDPRGMKAADAELIDDLRNLTRRVANKAAKLRIEDTFDDEPVTFRPCVSNAGENVFNPKTGRYR